MRNISVLLVLVTCLFACESVNYVPPVTPQIVAANKSGGVTVAALREGRTVFVSRCIECHTLPPVWQHNAEDWPNIVDAMSARANLKKHERDVLVAYILAIRSQK